MDKAATDTDPDANSGEPATEAGSVTIGDIEGGIHSSTIAGRDVTGNISHTEQSGGINLGTGNTIGSIGNIASRDYIETQLDNRRGSFIEGSTISAAGKNIIQIIGNTLNLPRYLVVAIVLGGAIVVVATIADAVWTRMQNQRAGEVLAIVSAPTATPTMTSTVTPIPTPTPVRMADGRFNIAVAEFDAVNNAGMPVSNKLTQELSMSIANYVGDETDSLKAIINQSVAVLGPDVLVRSVKANTVKEYADALNADVLVYGTLRQVASNRWQLEPKFYLTDESVKDADELAGEHALGTGISYIANNTASVGDVNRVLKIRLKALTQMLAGLAYLSFGNLEGYQKATNVLQQATEDSEWGAAKDSTGQEILYLFLGNAYLLQLGHTADDAPERSVLLTQSREAFSMAIRLNENYARAYNGLGLALYGAALPPSDGDDCVWDWNFLTESANAYTNALERATFEPSSGYVDYRAHFGLGRFYFWRWYCEVGEIEDYATAQEHYQFVVDTYEKMTAPLPRLIDLAAGAETDLGHIALSDAIALILQDRADSPGQTNSRLAQSISHYKHALQLSFKSGTEEVKEHAVTILPFYLTALCLDRQGQTAISDLNQFVAQGLLSDADLTNIEIFIEDIGYVTWKECSNARDE